MWPFVFLPLEGQTCVDKIVNEAHMSNSTMKNRVVAVGETVSWPMEKWCCGRWRNGVVAVGVVAFSNAHNPVPPTATTPFLQRPQHRFFMGIPCTIFRVLWACSPSSKLEEVRNRIGSSRAFCTPFCGTPSLQLAIENLDENFFGLVWQLPCEPPTKCSRRHVPAVFRAYGGCAQQLWKRDTSMVNNMRQETAGRIQGSNLLCNGAKGDLFTDEPSW